MKRSILLLLVLVCLSCNTDTAGGMLPNKQNQDTCDASDIYQADDTSAHPDFNDTCGETFQPFKKHPVAIVTLTIDCEDDDDQCTETVHDKNLGCIHVPYENCCEIASYDCNPPNLCYNSYCVSDAIQIHPYCTPVSFLCEDYDPCTDDDCWQGSGECFNEVIPDCCREHTDCETEDPHIFGFCLSTDDPESEKDYPYCIYP